VFQPDGNVVFRGPGEVHHRDRNDVFVVRIFVEVGDDADDRNAAIASIQHFTDGFTGVCQTHGPGHGFVDDEAGEGVGVAEGRSCQQPDMVERDEFIVGHLDAGIDVHGMFAFIRQRKAGVHIGGRREDFPGDEVDARDLLYQHGQAL
jgi:hypothetical protein